MNRTLSGLQDPAMSVGVELDNPEHVDPLNQS